MNKMEKNQIHSKAIETHTKESLKALCFEVFDGFRYLLGNRVASRFVALLSIIGLLMPLIFIGNFNSVSAQGNLASSSSAPIAAPPIAYSFGGNSKSFSPVLAVSNSFFGVASYFSAPELPKGFEKATPASPFYKDVSSVTYSISSSVGSFLGFFVNSSAETNSNLMADGGFPSGAVPFDFDDDDIADVSRWNPSTGEWKVKDNQGNFTTDTLGTSASVIVPGDYDGDSKTDKAVWTAGVWTIRKSDGTGDITYPFGISSDVPVSGDFDGDGLSDYAIYRSSTNTWWVRQSSNYAVNTTVLGASGDILVPGDYDGDDITDKAVYRPSTGVWHINGTLSGYFTANWGISTDTPIPADFNGDGKTDFGIFRPSTGTWYIYYTDNSTPYTATVWGNYGDQPVAADYDGDGKADLSVWRPKTGVWLIKESDGGTYKYETLGMNGDVPVPAAYIKKVGGSVAEYDSVKLRIDPINSTGGTDLYSRNFSWGTGLVGLSGRSGLGAGFGISYNSLLWLKNDAEDTISFDPDYSNVTPGFNMGFARIEPVYWDKNNGRFSYIMVTPSGSRVEFQQIGATEYYETADSSYVQLKTVGASNPNDPVGNISITITGTDGTKMEYEWKAGAFRAKEIKDTNGNYITINHDEYGLLKTVTDTLGRVITVNYDAELYPTTITQDWKTSNGSGSTTTHTYATFSYKNETLNPSFDSSLTVFGPTNGTVIKVLDKITSASGAYTQFEYNNYGQVWKINNHAIDGHKLNHTSVNIGSPTANQTDVPRFSETRSWIENFNLDTYGNEQETVYQNTFQTNQSYTTPAGSGTGTLIQVSMVNHPHGNISKTYVGSSGWMESLPIVTEDWTDENSTSTRKRWSWTNWTQDDTNLTYINNPRTTESKVGDDENNYIRRTTTDYRLLPNTTIAEYGLVDRVRIYDSNQTTVLKQVESDYNLSSVYVDKRIIGLPSETRAYGIENSTLSLVSKMTYAYDEGDFSDTSLEQTITPIQHYPTYGASFIIGRGNLTSTTRHDVSGTTSSVTSSVKYNTAGSPVAGISLDANNNNRIVKTSYVDKFNDSPSDKGTYAYPTKIITPSANNTGDIFSEVEYRYDIGANVWAESPGPNGNGTGKETTRVYDSLGRLEKQTLENTDAYTRYEYPTSQVYGKVYSTITDANASNSVDAADEVLSESWTDGAGRTLKSRTEHPNSVGGFSGGFVEYNNLGQATRSTTPTEINSSWAAVGDDSANPNFLWTSQEYDWKGRVIREINTDGTDRLISYTGCGCAGGQVTTIQSELVPTDDDPPQNARRTQKVYSDILGRNYKTEIYKWDGSTVYTTTTQKYNGRDQVTDTTQFEGTDNPSNTKQIVSMSYDGHGRMKTRHYPIEDVGANTSWNYNNDDSIDQIIDPRGAITDFTYNNLGLATQIDYTPPANPPANVVIPDTPTVNFTYNNLGQRTKMTDGTGETDYVYDDLSRLTSESKSFNDLPNAPVTNNEYTIAYTYNLAGALESITDPFGVTVDYTHDKIGRLTKVTGDALTNNPTGNYADNIKYRAFGAIKQIDYKMPNETAQIKMGYDKRLRIDHFEATSTQQTSGYLMKADYDYFNDSRTDSKDDLLDDKFDRINKYDFAGRLNFNQFGMGTDNNNNQVRVYEQEIEYDSFSMLVGRSGETWGNDIGFTGNTYLNGRIQNSTGLIYDAAGNFTHSAVNGNPHSYGYSHFDVTNRHVKNFSSSKGRMGSMLNMVTETQLEYVYDGEGRPVKSSKGSHFYHMNDPQPTMNMEVLGYQVWSTVLGSSLTSIKPTGEKLITKVFAGGAVIANQSHSGANWITADPVTGTEGAYIDNEYGQISTTTEHEPLGQEIFQSDPNDEISDPPPNEIVSYSEGMQWQCEIPQSFYGSFEQMPFHCQVARYNNPNLREEESPSHIDEESPTPGQEPVPEENTPTEKPQAEAGGRDANAGGSPGDGGVPPASIPDDDGETNDSHGSIVGVVNIDTEEGREHQTINSYGDVGTPAPLNKKEIRKIDAHVVAIEKRLKTKKCKEFLEQLGKDAIKNLSNQLKDKSKRFSAKRSTEITVEQAGLFGPNARQDALNERTGQALSGRLLDLDLTVSGWFQQFKDAARESRSYDKLKAAVGTGGRIFYSDYDRETVLHENLHVSSGGKPDKQLAEALGLGTFANRNEASNAISEALKKNKCLK